MSMEALKTSEQHRTHQARMRDDRNARKRARLLMKSGTAVVQPLPAQGTFAQTAPFSNRGPDAESLFQLPGMGFDHFRLSFPVQSAGLTENDELPAGTPNVDKVRALVSEVMKV